MKTTKERVFKIDREINDTDIWVVSIAGKKRRYVGGKTGLKLAFDKDVGDYVCTVVMRFIDKRSDLVEKYIKVKDMKPEEFIEKVFAPYVDKGMYCIIGYKKTPKYDQKKDVFKSNDLKEIVEAIRSESYYIKSFVYEGVEYDGVTINADGIVSFGD